MKNGDYKAFLAAKRIETHFPGLEPKEPHEILFDFQRDIVKWALRRGRACVFADCGMGKTFIQIEWARQIPATCSFIAIQTGRKFIGAELKASYWTQAVENLKSAEAQRGQITLSEAVA